MTTHPVASLFMINLGVYPYWFSTDMVQTVTYAMSQWHLKQADNKDGMEEWGQLEWFWKITLRSDAVDLLCG